MAVNWGIDIFGWKLEMTDLRKTKSSKILVGIMMTAFKSCSPKKVLTIEFQLAWKFWGNHFKLGESRSLTCKYIFLIVVNRSRINYFEIKKKHLIVLQFTICNTFNIFTKGVPFLFQAVYDWKKTSQLAWNHWTPFYKMLLFKKHYFLIVCSVIYCFTVI